MLSLNYFTLVTQIHFTGKTKTEGFNVERFSVWNTDNTTSPGKYEENVNFVPKDFEIDSDNKMFQIDT